MDHLSPEVMLYLVAHSDLMTSYESFFSRCPPIKPKLPDGGCNARLNDDQEVQDPCREND
jgi:hypothetical protein